MWTDKIVGWVGRLGIAVLVVGGAVAMHDPTTPGLPLLVAAGAVALGGWAVFDLQRLRERLKEPAARSMLRTLGGMILGLALAAGIVLASHESLRQWDVTRGGDHSPGESLSLALEELREAGLLNELVLTGWVRGHGDSVDAVHAEDVRRLLGIVNLAAPQVATRRVDVADEEGTPNVVVVRLRGAERVVPAPSQQDLAEALWEVSSITP
jgi:hypothetical protein